MALNWRWTTSRIVTCLVVAVVLALLLAGLGAWVLRRSVEKVFGPAAARGTYVLLTTQDFDGDGTAELICNSFAQESVWIVSPRTGRVLYQVQTGPNPAQALVVVGDADGDRVPDVWFRAESGVQLKSTRTGDVLSEIRQGEADRRLGAPMVGVEDRNGDGQIDLVVGAPHWVENPDEAPGAVSLLGSGSGEVLWTVPIPQPTSVFRSYFGDSLLTVPDVNGDAVPEISVTGSVGVKRVLYILCGATGREVSCFPTTFVWGDFARAMDVLGQWPDRAGPVIAMGDGGDSPPWVEVRSLSKQDVVLRVQGSDPNLRFGHSLRFVRDANGDGWPDLAIGSPGPLKGTALPGGLPWFGARTSDPSNGGEVRMVSGQTGDTLWIARGNAAWAWFGLSIAVVGDIDRDGCDDLAVAGEEGFGADERRPTLRLLSGATGHTVWEVSLTRK